MTLRFRNRFKTQTHEAGTCRCGRYLTHESNDGRETIIHQLPWCPEFEALVKRIEPERDVQMHVALMNPLKKETIVIADGDTPTDIQDPR